MKYVLDAAVALKWVLPEVCGGFEVRMGNGLHIAPNSVLRHKLRL